MKNIILLISFTLLLSCKENNKAKQLEKENYLLKKELELGKKEHELMNIKTEDIDAPKTIQTISYIEFIPNDYEIVIKNGNKELIEADINLDGINDLAAIIAKGKNLKSYDNVEDIRIIIIVGAKDGNFTEVTKSGNLTNTFLYNNSDSQIKLIKPNLISITQQAMRSDYELKFRFDSKRNNFVLIGSEFNNYGNAFLDGAGNISTNFLTKTRIKKLKKYDHTNKKLIQLEPIVLKIKTALLTLKEINGENIYEIIGSD